MPKDVHCVIDDNLYKRWQALETKCYYGQRARLLQSAVRQIIEYFEKQPTASDPVLNFEPRKKEGRVE